MVKLTKKMLDFCKYYAISRDTAKSAIKAGYSKMYADKKAYQLLDDERIKQTIKEFEDKYLSEEFKKLSNKAISKLNDVLEDDTNRYTQLKAIVTVLQINGIVNKNGEPIKDVKPKDDTISLIIPDEYKDILHQEK